MNAVAGLIIKIFTNGPERIHTSESAIPARTLTVWACIGHGGIITYDVSRDTMNGIRYCEILNKNDVPYFTCRPTTGTRNQWICHQNDASCPLQQMPVSFWMRKFREDGLEDADQRSGLQEART